MVPVVAFVAPPPLVAVFELSQAFVNFQWPSGKVSTHAAALS